ncbi:hypothetical protein HHK36_021329 [Tetracentron sinense]|uniref:Aberrant root formation protein 4 n=1 Tax=Tetracentron sinense TaxID=13715 RepID=A0A835D794_TETSI|nr:hypothetical protein HHK36_021329 [Tetracentron sinense]
MSVEIPDSSIRLREVQIHESSDHPLVLRLHETLTTCSKSIETGDFRQSERAVAELVDFLDSVYNATVSDHDDEVSMGNSVEVLEEIHRFLCSPLSGQMVVDALSFELPKAVAKFAGVSDKCLEIAESIIDHLISTCSARDMLSILCEVWSLYVLAEDEYNTVTSLTVLFVLALDSPNQMFNALAYFSPLLGGLSKVFLCIQRRHFEQIKVAVPVILNVLKAVSSESDDGDKGSVTDLIGRAINIATSIQSVIQKLEGNKNEELCALLGLFVLQIMVDTTALVSSNMTDEVLGCVPLVLQLSEFLPFCGLSYLGLITGCVVDSIIDIILGDDNDDYMSCFSFAKHGASLAVIWGHISDEVAEAAKEDLAVVMDKIRSSQTKRWQAVGMLKYILCSIDQPWELKKHAIDFLLSIMDENFSQKYNDENTDCSVYMPSLFAALQAIEKVIIYASDRVLRKNAFAALKKVLAEIPTYQRFDILKALITDTDFPSMIAILIDLLKEEMYMENRQKVTPRDGENLQVKIKAYPSSPFWSSNVLEVVELILKPPKGGPPCLPEHSDAVLSALNLYRFVLITESTGKTNYTGVLSENTLRKAYTEWLLPLRMLVTGIAAENEKDYDQFAVETVCSLNPVELVLYRCIELVEEKLKQFT